MRRKLSALVGPRPVSNPEPEIQPESQRLTLPQVSDSAPQEAANNADKKEVPSRKTMPFPFVIAKKADPESVRPPFESITREKKPKPEPDEESQIRSGKTMRFIPPEQPVQPPQPEQKPEPTPKAVAVPVRRQLMNTMVDIDQALIPRIPPENVDSKPNPTPKVEKISRNTRIVIMSVLAGVAIGMAGNVAYWHYTQEQPKTPASKLDNSNE
ncbi:MAG: hypothetical protein R3B71_04150 [Candidatus Gracilibacteria bacterium]